jgi:hypothetical protein
VKEKFYEYGVTKLSGIYEYSSDIVQKYKSELSEIVKAMLATSSVNKNTNPFNNDKNTNQSEVKQTGMIKEFSEVNFDDIPVNKPPVEEKQKEPEYKQAIKFNIGENVNVKVISNGTESKSRRNNQKIQKVDFDFNFDNFNETNFSSLNSFNDTSGKKTNFDQEFASTSTTATSSSYSTYNKKNKYDDVDDDNEFIKAKISKEEINKKFANKKAISSEDYADLEENSNVNNSYKNKLNNMKYSQAICSSDLYEEPNRQGINN